MKKNIIGMYFDTKSYLKSTRNHTVKHDLGLNLGKSGQKSTHDRWAKSTEITWVSIRKEFIIADMHVKLSN